MKNPKEFTLSVEAVEAIIKKHKLGELSTIRIVEKGLVNPMYEINGTYMLRLHIREPHLLKLEKEAYVYKLVYRKSKGKIPVPKIIALDTSKTMLHCNYSIMNKIEGDDLDDVWQTMNDGEKKDVCYQLGRLLAQLHAIEMKAFGGLVSGTITFKTWYAFIMHTYSYYLENHKKYGIISKDLLKRIEERFKRDDYLLKIKTKPVLLHGDCQRENIKIKDGKIAGVFDFEWSIAGHNEFEFKSILSPSKKHKILQEEVMKGYESITPLSPEFPQRVKLYIIINCLDFLEAAHLHWEDDEERIQKYLGVIETQLQE